MVVPQRTLEVDVSDVFLRLDTADVGVQDLQDLPGSALNAVSVTQTLVARFTRDIIYTYAGPVLVALNPYALLTDEIGAPIYDASVMYRYRRWVGAVGHGGCCWVVPFLVPWACVHVDRGCWVEEERGCRWPGVCP